MDQFPVIVFFIGAALAICIVMHFVDKNRIKDEVEARGGRIVSISWNPFGRGWFFEKGERHYSVTYIEPSGRHGVGDLQDQSVHRHLLGRCAAGRRAATEIHFTPSLLEVRVWSKRRMAGLSQLRQANRICLKLARTVLERLLPECRTIGEKLAHLAPLCRSFAKLVNSVPTALPCGPL